MAAAERCCEKPVAALVAITAPAKVTTIVAPSENPRFGPSSRRKQGSSASDSLKPGALGPSFRWDDEQQPVFLGFLRVAAGQVVPAPYSVRSSPPVVTNRRNVSCW
jgi:hypothetical protein